MRADFEGQPLLVRFAERVPDDHRGFPFVAETALMGYRTDLDRPTWQELHALILHGASSAAVVKNDKNAPTLEVLRKTILDVLVAAGAPEGLSPPGVSDLAKCHRRPVGRVIVHLIAMVVCLLGLAGVVWAGAGLIWSKLFPPTVVVKHDDEARWLLDAAVKQGLAQTHIILELQEQVEAGKKTIAELRAALKQAKASLKEIERLAETSKLTPEQQQDVQTIRSAITRASARNVLSQIGLALHAYHDTGAARKPDGALSWRSKLLPFIEQPILPKKGIPDEETLLREAGRIFQINPPAGNKNTSFVAVVGPGTFWDRSSRKPGNVVDGTTNLIAVLEVRDSGIPIFEDKDFTVEQALTAVTSGNSNFPGGSLALMADGSVRFISRTVSPRDLRRLLQHDASVDLPE